MQQIFQIPAPRHHPQLDANVPEKCKHAIQCWKFSLLWLRKAASSNSSNADWICGLNPIPGEKIVGCWDFSHQKGNYSTIHITEDLVTQDRKRWCKGWKHCLSSKKIQAMWFGAVQGGAAASACCSLWSSLVSCQQGTDSVFHDHTKQISKKNSHIAYLLNSQFALKDSQAEPERIWGAWINFLQLQVPSDDSLLWNWLLHTLSYSVKCILMQYANKTLKTKNFKCWYLKCTSPQHMIMVLSASAFLSAENAFILPPLCPYCSGSTHFIHHPVPYTEPLCSLCTSSLSWSLHPPLLAPALSFGSSSQTLIHF